MTNVKQLITTFNDVCLSYVLTVSDFLKDHSKNWFSIKNYFRFDFLISIRNYTVQYFLLLC